VGYVSEVWLSVPEAVFVIATGDLQRAREFPQDDANFLVFLVARELASKPHFFPLGPSFSEEQFVDSWRAARQRLSDDAPDTEVYGLRLKALRQILADGLARAKGSRKLDGPFELIDPVEFTQVVFVILHAINVITKQVVWYNVRVSARDLLERRQREQFGDSPQVWETTSINSKPDSPKRSGGWQNPRWLGAGDAAMQWLVDNGYPTGGDGNQAKLERHIASWLEACGEHVGEATIRRHVVDWIRERRVELGVKE
jgi:hypothetical protein